MSIWTQTAVLGLYTLTPTHYGTGQTTGAVDLPIARDAATDFPVLPATGIKGVLRAAADVKDKVIKDLFGLSLADGEDSLTAGRLAFTEARLVAYPARAISRPFLHVTCPLILETLARTLRATGAGASPEVATLDQALARQGGEGTEAWVADPKLAGQALVLEDLIYSAAEVGHHPAVAKLAEALADLLPADETATRDRLKSGLVVLPDADFAALMRSAVPVVARVQLTGGKTTDKWNNPETGTEESGNLWYEEALPTDCLFVALIGERRASRKEQEGSLGELTKAYEAFRVLQIGGNETVGQGLCLATLRTVGGGGVSS